MENNPLSFLAASMENVVLFDREGHPSFFVKFPKMKSSDLDSSLPNHTHPAFIINGREQDFILIGQYIGSSIDGSATGTIYSIPFMPPLNGRTADEYLEQCREYGQGSSGMTIADYGLLLLLAQKMGWKPGGNNSYGADISDGLPLDVAEYCAVGEKYSYRGWLYECVSAHTPSASNAPDKTPAYWKKLRPIGGTEARRGYISEIGNITMTLTGSGPMNWYLDGNPASVCDLVGNLNEIRYGYRIVNGELQILPDNNAAHPEADLSDGSAAWRAILPNAENDGFTLVAPGTAGTLKWNRDSNDQLMLDTETFDSSYINSEPFAYITRNSANVPYVPYILKELGIYPTSGSDTAGNVTTSAFDGEHIFVTGGNYTSFAEAGMGCQNYIYSSFNRIGRCGCRMRAIAGKGDNV